MISRTSSETSSVPPQPPFKNEMCAATGFPVENVRRNWISYTKCAPQLENVLKSGRKPHRMSPIPATPENPGKNLTIWTPSPGPAKIQEKSSQYYAFACCWLMVVGCWLLVGSDKLCRGPLRGNKSTFSPSHFLTVHKLNIPSYFPA